MQPGASIGDEFLNTLEISIDYASLFKAVHDYRTNVSIATNCGCVAESLRRFFDCCHQLSFCDRLLSIQVGCSPCERASANQGSSPSAKILGAEIPSHYFLDVDVNVTSVYVDKSAFAVLVLEHVAGRMAQQLSDNASHSSITQLAMLANA